MDPDDLSEAMRGYPLVVSQQRVSGLTQRDHRWLNHYFNEIERTMYWGTNDCPETFSENPSKYARCLAGQTGLYLRDIPERVLFQFENLMNPGAVDDFLSDMDNTISRLISPTPLSDSSELSLQEFDGPPSIRSPRINISRSASTEENQIRQMRGIAQSPPQRADLEGRIINEVGHAQRNLERAITESFKQQQLPSLVQTFQAQGQYNFQTLRLEQE